MASLFVTYLRRDGHFFLVLVPFLFSSVLPGGVFWARSLRLCALLSQGWPLVFVFVFAGMASGLHGAGHSLLFLF